MQIRLSPSQNLHIQTASDIFQLLQPAFLRQSKLNRDREHLWLMCLDHSQSPGSQSGAGCTLELLGLGTQQTVLIDAMPRFQIEAAATGKRGIVVAHNHPAGSLKPSRFDITATEKLVDASHFLNIKLLDHLIISEKEFYSFRDGGEFEKMNTRKFIMFNSVLAME